MRAAEIAVGFERWLGPDAVIDDAQDRYAAIAESIAVASCGEPSSGVDVDVDDRLAIVRSVADGVASRWFRPHQRRPTMHQRAEPTGDPLGSVVPSRMVDRVPINTAGVDELAALPGLGRVTAARIIAKRPDGGYRSIDELTGIRGLSRSAREQVWSLTTTLVADEPVGLTSARLGSQPVDFSTACRHMAATGFVPAPVLDRLHSPHLPALPRLVLVCLEAVVAEVRRRPYWGVGRSAAAPKHVESETPPPGTGPAQIVVLRNSQYLGFVEQRIAEAVDRVLVQMFFVSSAEDGSPGERLSAALGDAVTRGLDVRVILDTDHDEVFAPADELNDAAAARLEGLGVRVRRDLDGTKTHAKTVIVDDALVVGTHNWTTNSLYRLDESSLVIDSHAAAKVEVAHFERLWLAFDPDGSRRSTHLSLIRYPTADERTRLAAAGITDSAGLFAQAGQVGQVRPLAKSIGVDPARLEVLWRALRLMAELRLAEHVAVAFAMSDINSPSEVRRASMDRRRDAIAQVTPLPAPYAGASIDEDLYREP